MEKMYDGKKEEWKTCTLEKIENGKREKLERNINVEIQKLRKGKKWIMEKTEIIEKEREWEMRRRKRRMKIVSLGNGNFLLFLEIRFSIKEMITYLFIT